MTGGRNRDRNLVVHRTLLPRLTEISVSRKPQATSEAWSLTPGPETVDASPPRQRRTRWLAGLASVSKVTQTLRKKSSRTESAGQRRTNCVRDLGQVTIECNAQKGEPLKVKRYCGLPVLGLVPASPRVGRPPVLGLVARGGCPHQSTCTYACCIPVGVCYATPWVATSAHIARPSQRDLRDTMGRAGRGSGPTHGRCIPPWLWGHPNP